MHKTGWKSHREACMDWLKDRLGLRGTAMLILGVGWVLIGYSVLIDVSRPPPGAFHAYIPLWISVPLWWASALLSIIFAWSKRYDYIGIAALTIMPMIRSISFTGSWILGVAPQWIIDMLPGEPVEGWPPAWLSAAYSLLLLAFVLIVANIRQGPVPTIALARIANEERIADEEAHS